MAETPSDCFGRRGVGAAAGIQNVDETGFILNGWGSALVDLDRDGWLDLIVGNQWFNDESYPGGLRIWHNEGGGEVTRHWVGVKLVARVSNPSALGARVSVSANGRTQIVDVASQSSISTVGPLPVHVGIHSQGACEPPQQTSTGTFLLEERDVDSCHGADSFG